MDNVSYMGKLYDEGINAVLVNQRAMPSYLMDPFELKVEAEFFIKWQILRHLNLKEKTIGHY